MTSGHIETYESGLIDLGIVCARVVIIICVLAILLLTPSISRGF